MKIFLIKPGGTDADKICRQSTVLWPKIDKEIFLRFLNVRQCHYEFCNSKINKIIVFYCKNRHFLACDKSRQQVWSRHENKKSLAKCYKNQIRMPMFSLFLPKLWIFLPITNFSQLFRLHIHVLWIFIVGPTWMPN